MKRVAYLLGITFIALVLAVAGAHTAPVTASAANCSVTPIRINQTMYGQLTTSDGRSPIKGSSYYCDRYTFYGTAGQRVVILLTSSAFDTFLYLIGPSGSVLTYDDDGGPGTGSRIPPLPWPPRDVTYTLPSSGTYTIEVTSNSPNATGSYTLILVDPFVRPLDCRSVYELRGIFCFEHYLNEEGYRKDPVNLIFVGRAANEVASEINQHLNWGAYVTIPEGPCFAVALNSVSTAGIGNLMRR
jgi:hypothetical protein